MKITEMVYNSTQVSVFIRNLSVSQPIITYSIQLGTVSFHAELYFQLRYLRVLFDIL